MQIRAIQSILEKIVPGVFEKILRKILARVVTLSSLCILFILFADVTMYEPDADMIFNYLMVSALANSTDIIEKKNLKATGGNYDFYRM